MSCDWGSHLFDRIEKLNISLHGVPSKAVHRHVTLAHGGAGKEIGA